MTRAGAADSAAHVATGSLWPVWSESWGRSSAAGLACPEQGLNMEWHVRHLRQVQSIHGPSPWKLLWQAPLPGLLPLPFLAPVPLLPSLSWLHCSQLSLLLPPLVCLPCFFLLLCSLFPPLPSSRPSTCSPSIHHCLFHVHPYPLSSTVAPLLPLSNLCTPLAMGRATCPALLTPSPSDSLHLT